MTGSSRFHTTALICTLAALTPGLAMAQAPKPIDVPEQPLADALAELGAETGLRIAAHADVIEGKRSRAVLGPMTPNEALRLLLTGTGLSMRDVGAEGSIVMANVAAQNASEPPVDLGTLVLRGELLERDLQASQTSAVVVDGADLDRGSDATLYDTIARTPGVSLGGGFSTPTIRGINLNGATGNGTSPTVSLTVDGSAISDFALLVETGPYSTWDLEQVEVLRGPQSTQTGRNAIGGAINIRSADPIMGQEFKLRTEMGNFNSGGLSFAANTANQSETFALRFSGDIRGTDGSIENTVTGDEDIGLYENKTYRLGLLWEPTDRLSTVLKYTNAHVLNGVPQVYEDGFPEDRENDSNIRTFQETDFDLWNLRTTYKISPSMEVRYEFSDMVADYFQVLDSDFGPMNAGDFTRIRDFRNRQHELRFVYDGDRSRGVFGLSHATITTEDESIGTFPFGVVVASLVAVGDTEIINRAAFGEIEYDLSDKLTLVAGLRYDEQEEDNFLARTITAPIPLPFPAEPPTSRDSLFGAWLPKLGVIYDFDDRRSLGFTVQRGYRSGGSSNVPAIGVVDFNPEYTTNYELAYRSEAADGSWTLNANAFYAHWIDQQVTVGTSIADTRTINAGESEYYGVELSGTWLAYDALDLFASAAWVETRFLSFRNNAENFAGNAFRDAPAFAATLGGTYTFDNGVYVSGDVNFTEASFSDVANDFVNDAYTVVNVQTGYRTGAWEVSAYARNLFDEGYTTSSGVSGGVDFVIPGAPRTYGIVLQTNF